MAEISGLTATVSDVLDDLGYQLALPTSEISPLNKSMRVVGPALTLRYLPERQVKEKAPARLAHNSAFNRASPGDVLVVEGDTTARYSVLGGLAAFNAQERGLAACLVDGAVRDVDEISKGSLGVWSRGTTCVTGNGRLEGIAFNQPIRFSDVQVHPGDVVVADASGICFIPPDVLEVVCQRVLTIRDEELDLAQRR